LEYSKHDLFNFCWLYSNQPPEYTTINHSHPWSEAQQENKKRSKQCPHFVGYFNNERCHESLDNLTQGDIFFGKVERV
jgi:hypothetical protein